MRDEPYTQGPMEPARAGTDVRDSRFDGLHAEAAAAVGDSANTLRSVRERYHEADSDALVRWRSVRDALETHDRGLIDVAPAASTLHQLGLDGAITDTVENMRTLIGAEIATDLTAPSTVLSDGERTVALRVAQEALQNVRKHAAANSVIVATRMDSDEWVLEVRDDGRGFDDGAVAGRGRRNFGLQFKRERAELIGARFDVRSRPDGGTVVRLAIPTEAGAGEEEST